nr:helix-turn-helix domain-containing protein [uncultured Glaciecola sp.]
MTISSWNANYLNKDYSSLEACLESASKSGNYTLGPSHRVYHTRQTLISVGDEFEGLYILRSGSAKAVINSADGEEYITKFFYPGDILGVDGFDQHIHMHNVLFLETSSVCFIKESDLNDLVRNQDDFRHSLLKAISHTLTCDSSMLMCLSSYSSEQKVAHFILERADHFACLGLSGTQFRLSMSRTDIANYLGMALETVSRIFAGFQLKKLVSVSNRQLSILDITALSHILSRDLSSNSLSTSSHSKISMGDSFFVSKSENDNSVSSPYVRTHR